MRIDATVWAWMGGPGQDRLDLYYAANATSPTWVYVGTLTPPAAGVQVLSATYTLPNGATQAVRARSATRAWSRPAARAAGPTTTTSSSR